MREEQFNSEKKHNGKWNNIHKLIIEICVSLSNCFMIYKLFLETKMWKMKQAVSGTVKLK